MKKILSALLALFILTALYSCDGPKNEKREKRKTEGDCFYIVHSPEAVDRQISNTVASMLEDDGRDVLLFESYITEKHDIGCVKAVITVGQSEAFEFSEKDNGIDILHIYCQTDGGGASDTSKKGLAPTLESSRLADAAMILLPDAMDFSIISSASGATDVQNACDLFDRTGKNYTVESLDGRIYGEVLLSCLESDADALLLPSGSCGNKNASAAALPYIPESDVPVIAVGMGEPIKGALATFCIDSSALSSALYSLINSEVYGHTAAYPESYYVLCINKDRAAHLDERAKKNITEIFPVVWVE